MNNLLHSPELLAALLAGMLDGLSIVDERGAHIFVNDALCDMLGFTREELIGARPPYPYWPEDERAAIESAFQRTLQGDRRSFELVFVHKDGRRVEVIVAPSQLRDDNGNVIAYFATVKDISERKRMERAQLESEQRWRSIAENPFDFVVVIDRDYRYTYINHTAPGLSREDLIGRATPFDFVDAKHHDAMRRAFDATVATGRANSYEVHVPQLDAWYASVVGPVLEHGVVTGLSILTRETTEQKRAEEALLRSEQRLRESHRIETIGTLAGGIAHDINNMLTPILGYTDLAQVELSETHPVHEHLQGIRIASLRARELVQRILLFSRRQEPRKALFDLRQSVREDVTLLRASLPAGIELTVELPDTPVMVFADRAQLGQVVTNLATNALHAMKEHGGKLTIALRPAEDAAFTLLRVTDTGPGMDADVMRRVFDPFFTTKPVGAGTGLGLSIVHSVVREHGGETTVQSKQAHGTTFTVRLPTAAATHTANQTANNVTTAATTSRNAQPLRVLVVDDEPAIVAVANQALTRAGHVVTTAASALHALELFRGTPDAFDLILTDQSMPNMTGTSLIAEVRSLRPSLPCMLMTGLGDETTQRQAAALRVFEIIAKPFSLATLLTTVERARDACAVEHAVMR